MSLSIALTIGLLVLPIIWFITDPRPFKERLEQYLTVKGIIVTVIEIVVVSLNYLNSNTLNLNNIFPYLGLVLYFLGLFIAIWAKLTMGKHWGRPAEYSFKRQNKLIVSGPFKYSRNPIYLGLILAFLGYSLALRSVYIILNILVIGYFYYAAVKEEKILEKIFGQEYLNYKSKVGRFV